MSQIVEREEFISVIDTSLGEVEESIDGSYFYLLIYRLVHYYGNIRGLQVRCKFERILDCQLLEEASNDTSLKQRLWEYGVCFSEDTMTDVYDNGEKRMLMVMPEWTSTNGLAEVINEKRASGEFEMAPTDLFIENLNTNSEYDKITEVLNNSPYAGLTIWYIRKDYNYYADFAERDEVYGSMFSEKEIYDITPDMDRLIDVPNIPYDIVDSLIDLGHQLYMDGFKCLGFNNISPELHYTTEHAYYTMVTSFLVYMSETYNMFINTTCDEIFCNQYVEYRKSSYCLAEDLFNNRSNYFPIMSYVTRNDSRFLYIRRIESRYTFYYFRENELERLITGDTDVRIHKWSPQFVTALKDRGVIINKDKLDVSEYLDELNDSGNDDDNKDPEVIPLFSYITSEERLNAIIEAINKYNANYHESVVTKYVTARDLVCRRAKDGDNEYIEVGYIQSMEEDSYDYRIAESITVSSINEQMREMISRSYFSLTRNLNHSLYSLHYTYDLGINAPKRLLDFVEDTQSLISDVSDPYEVSEDGTLERIYSATEKFLYYVFSKYMPVASYRKLEEDLTGDKLEYKVALYHGVYTVSEVLPEFQKYFALRDLIEADLLDSYGNINSEYISNDGNVSYFDLKNKLFGIMKIDR